MITTALLSYLLLGLVFFGYVRVKFLLWPVLLLACVHLGVHH